MSKPKSQHRMREEVLQGENAALRERIGIEIGAEVDAWESAIAQRVRDELAVRALFLHSGDMYAALGFMGFIVPAAGADRRALAQRIFGTRGVRELLERDCSDLEQQRVAIIARQMQIALYGDERSSTAAATLLARIGGWQKQPEGGFNNGAVNVNVLLNGAPTPVVASAVDEPKLAAPAFGILDHEPGAPIRVHSEAMDDA